MPVVREETLKECPELPGLLEELGELLTDEVMVELNYKVDELQQTPEKVAGDFLRERGLVS